MTITGLCWPPASAGQQVSRRQLSAPRARQDGAQLERPERRPDARLVRRNYNSSGARTRPRPASRPATSGRPTIEFGPPAAAQIGAPLGRPPLGPREPAADPAARIHSPAGAVIETSLRAQMAARSGPHLGGFLYNSRGGTENTTQDSCRRPFNRSDRCERIMKMFGRLKWEGAADCSFRVHSFPMSSAP